MDRIYFGGDGVLPHKTPEMSMHHPRKESWWSDRKCLPHLKEAGPNDVICARGKQAMIHIGNKRLRALIRSELENYDQAFLKAQKSSIVTTIVANVRLGSPLGGFIKFDSSSGMWWEVGDNVAREKVCRVFKSFIASPQTETKHEVGQIFRDALYAKYKSSTRMKILKRTCERKRSIPELKFPRTHGLEGPIHLLACMNEETLRAHDVQAVKVIARGLGDNQAVDNFLMKHSSASSVAQSVAEAGASSDGSKPVLTAEDNQQRNHSDNGNGRHEQLHLGSSMPSSLELPSPRYCLEDGSPPHKNDDRCQDGVGRVNNTEAVKLCLAEFVVGRKNVLPYQCEAVSSQLTATKRASEAMAITTEALRSHKKVDTCQDGLDRVNNTATVKKSLAELAAGRNNALPSKCEAASSQLSATKRVSEALTKTTAAPRPHRSNERAICVKEGTAQEDSSSVADALMERSEDMVGTSGLIYVQQAASDSTHVPAPLTTQSSSASFSGDVVRRVSCQTNDGQNQAHLSPMLSTENHGSQPTRRFPPIIGLDDDEVAVFDATLALAMDEILLPADPKALQEFSLQRFYQTYVVDGQVANPPATDRYKIPPE